jgi:hypothetical protein
MNWGIPAMQPVPSAAPSTDGDNEATAELPVLDVAAYEASLSDPFANTDTWNLPAAIPTLRAAEDEDVLDLSGTHELPALPKTNKPPAAVTVTANLAATATAVAIPTATTSTATGTHIVLPPSPPLIEDLRAALAAAERRIEELNERARIADAERSVAIARATAENAQLRAQWSGHLESLHTARGRLGAQRADESGLHDELFARADRLAVQERELAARAAELQQLRAALDAGEQRCARLETDTANLRASVARRDEQLAMLQADLAARQAREESLKTRLAEAIAVTDPNAPDLRVQAGLLEVRIRDLESQLTAARGALAEKNNDLEVAEECIRNLELDVRDKTGKLEEVSVTVEEWRAVIAESQRSILQRDGRIQQLEADLEKHAAAAAHRLEQTGEEIALEGPARVLIRTDGNTDFVHVLGRRTRIGRGSDNELVLDTKHVSRYHAVLLAGPAHTSIEDLNSTNGVFVNGKRVARQVLKDGDKVTIGRTQFRYTVRT